jgi:hypothetical protein
MPRNLIEIVSSLIRLLIRVGLSIVDNICREVLEIRTIMAAASKSKAEKEREKVQQDRCQVSSFFLNILLFSLQGLGHQMNFC